MIGLGAQRRAPERPRRGVWLVAAAVVAGQGALAQDPEAALDVVTACLSAAAGAAEARDCIGIYARVCAEEDFGASDDLRDCLVAETAAWDRLTDEAFAELIILARDRVALEEQAGQGGQAHDELLRIAQGAWLTFRDADCAQESAAPPDRAIGAVVGAWCGLERTAERAISLRSKRSLLEAP